MDAHLYLRIETVISGFIKIIQTVQIKKYLSPKA